MLILRLHVIFVRLEHLRGLVLRLAMLAHKVTLTRTRILALGVNGASQVNIRQVAEVTALTAQVVITIVIKTHQHHVIPRRPCVQLDHIRPRDHSGVCIALPAVLMPMACHQLRA
jgi:hypothetical protein